MLTVSLGSQNHLVKVQKRLWLNKKMSIATSMKRDAELLVWNAKSFTHHQLLLLQQHIDIMFETGLVIQLQTSWENI